MKDQYYSVQEFARLKSISRQAVYELIKKDEIDAEKKYEKTLIINNHKAKQYQSHQGKPVKA